MTPDEPGALPPDPGPAPVRVPLPVPVPGPWGVPPPPAPRRGGAHRRPSRRHPLLALGCALVVAAGGLVAVRATAADPDVRARPTPTASPSAPDPALVAREARTAAVRALLDERAAAVRRRDRAAFLRGLDPTAAAAAFRGRQAAMFDALGPVPLSTWRYELQPDVEQAGDPALDRRRGRGWWAPEVTLRYGITGVDTAPLSLRSVFTFVERGGRWVIAADDDFEAISERTGRQMWDFGPLAVVRGTRSIVLGPASERPLLRAYARAADAAIPTVNAVWGSAWARSVAVLVPRTAADLGRLLDSRTDYRQIAAFATAASPPGEQLLGARVVVNLAVARDLSPLGREIVMRHEVAHLATRPLLEFYVPKWLDEGMADLLGYRGSDLPVRDVASTVRDAVRAGRGPTAFPPDSDFAPEEKGLASSYEEGYLAVRYLVERFGQDRVVRLYRALGSGDVRPFPDPTEPSAAEQRRTFQRRQVAVAVQQYLGVPVERLTRDWSAWVRRTLR